MARPASVSRDRKMPLKRLLESLIPLAAVGRTHLLEPFRQPAAEQLVTIQGETSPAPPGCGALPSLCGEQRGFSALDPSSAEVKTPSPSRQAASSRHFLRGLLCCSQLQDVLCFPFPCFSALYFSFDFRFPPLSIFQLFPQIIPGHGTSSPREPSWRYERL